MPKARRVATEAETLRDYRNQDELYQYSELWKVILNIEYGHSSIMMTKAFKVETPDQLLYVSSICKAQRSPGRVPTA